MKELQIIPALLLIVLLAAGACSLDYESAEMAEDLDQEIPNSVLINFSQVLVRDSEPAFLVEAARAEDYGKKKETRLTDIHFIEYDKDGAIVTDGHADYAILNNDTRNVELWGNLFFYSAGEEAEISGEYLFWNDAERTLTSKPELPVRIKKDQGTEIEGQGFTADFKTLDFTFEEDVTGTYVSDDEEDE